MSTAQSSFNLIKLLQFIFVHPSSNWWLLALSTSANWFLIRLVSWKHFIMVKSTANESSGEQLSIIVCVHDNAILFCWRQTTKVGFLVSRSIDKCFKFRKKKLLYTLECRVLVCSWKGFTRLLEDRKSTIFHTFSSSIDGNFFILSVSFGSLLSYQLRKVCFLF